MSIKVIGYQTLGTTMIFSFADGCSLTFGANIERNQVKGLLTMQFSVAGEVRMIYWGDVPKRNQRNRIIYRHQNVSQKTVAAYWTIARDYAKSNSLAFPDLVFDKSETVLSTLNTGGVTE